MTGRKKAIIAAGILLYLIVAVIAFEYVAAVLYFVANKAMPHGITFSSWYQYWCAYSDNEVQSGRLRFSAAGGFVIGFVMPAYLFTTVYRQTRALHGEARFANVSEIRKSGLL